SISSSWDVIMHNCPVCRQYYDFAERRETSSGIFVCSDRCLAKFENPQPNRRCGHCGILHFSTHGHLLCSKDCKNRHVKGQNDGKTLPLEANCVKCGTQFDRWDRRHRLCDLCRSGDRRCQHCGKRVTGGHGRKYCSVECRKIATAARRRG